jgi:sterol desaturase/sphingolipid hydroxylase (fatty acid hydroxylase superfamily)
MTLWDFTYFNIFLYCLTAITTHLLMSLGQTLFHRYLGHHRLGGRFFTRHLQFHHAFYSGDHIISSDHPDNEGNNTPFFLIPTVLVIGLSYLFLRLDLFFVQLVAMSLSFGAHVYLDKQYHMAGSWLGRFSWFREKQQLHLVHHRHADCNFAVIDFFWDRVFGSYLQPGTARQGRGSRGSSRGKPRFITKVTHRKRPLGEQPRPLAMPTK